VAGTGGGAGASACPDGGLLTFDDDFSAGFRSQYWTVTHSTPGLFTVDATQGQVQLTKVGSNTTPGLQTVSVSLNLAQFGGSIAGDFDFSVDFSNVVLGSAGVDQVQLDAHFADGSYFFDVYDNSDGGNNVHVWTGSINGRMARTVTGGTFRIARVGTTVSGYLGATLIYSTTSTSPLAIVGFILQLQPNSNDNIAVAYDNFHFSAACNRAGGGAACLGNVSIDFAALAPYWIDSSAACGSASVSAKALQLTRTGTCTAAREGGFVTLDPSRWKLCGDFDVQVDFNLVAFTVPTGGTQTRYAVVRAGDPSSTSGIALERYNAPTANTCPPSTQNYKGWSTTSVDCGGATMVATTDTTGKFRLTRVGSTVTSYYDSSAGNGSWVAVHTATGITTTPWGLVFYTGYALGTDRTDMNVTFSSLTITSGSAP
jgi:hypothetical protein